MITEQQRRELADFVRSRRERRSPAEAGVTAVGRRRTPGLRREEVAALAGLSITWYTWLEQARPTGVSRQVLASLARALGLDAVETAHLYELAGEVPPAGAPREPGDMWRYHLLLDSLDPNPAYLCNRRYDLIAWNRASTVLFGDPATLPEPDRNLLWLVFTWRELRGLFDDWELEAARSVALFRAQAGESLVRPEFVELIERLDAASPEFRRAWRRRDLTSCQPATHHFNHPKLGRATFEYVKMHVAGGDGILTINLTVPGSELAGRLAELIAAA